MSTSKRTLGAADHNKENTPTPERFARARATSSIPPKSATPTKTSAALSSRSSTAATNKTTTTTTGQRPSVRESKRAGQNAIRGGEDGSKQPTKMSAATLKRLSGQQTGKPETTSTAPTVRTRVTTSATPSLKDASAATSKATPDSTTANPSSPSKRSSASSNARRFSTASASNVLRRSVSPSKPTSPRKSILQVDFSEPDDTSDLERNAGPEEPVEDLPTPVDDQGVGNTSLPAESVEQAKLIENIKETHLYELGKLKQQHEDECQRLQEAIENSRKDSEHHEELYQGQVQESLDVRADNEHLRSRVTELSRDEARKIELIEQLHNDLQQCRRELQELQDFKEHNNHLLKQNQYSNVRIESLQQIISSKEQKERTEQQELLEENNHLMDRNKVLERKIFSLEHDQKAETDRFLEEISKMTMELEDATNHDALSNENEYLQAKTEKLEGEIDSYKSELKFIEHYKAEVERVSNEVRTLSHQLDEKTQDVQRHSIRNDGLVEQIADLEERLAEKENKLEHKKSLETDLARQVANLEEDVSYKLEDLKNKASLENTLKEKIADAENNLAQKDKEHKTEIEQLNADLSRITQDLEDANEESAARALDGDSRARQFLQEYYEVLQIFVDSPDTLDVRELHYQVLQRIEELLRATTSPDDEAGESTRPGKELVEEIGKDNVSQREEIRKQANEYEEIFGLLMEGAVLRGKVVELKAENFERASSKIPDVLPQAKRAVTPPDSGVSLGEGPPNSSPSSRSTPTGVLSPTKRHFGDLGDRARTDEAMMNMFSRMDELYGINNAASFAKSLAAKDDTPGVDYLKDADVENEP